MKRCEDRESVICGAGDRIGSSEFVKKVFDRDPCKIPSPFLTPSGELYSWGGVFAFDFEKENLSISLGEKTYQLGLSCDNEDRRKEIEAEDFTFVYERTCCNNSLSCWGKRDKSIKCHSSESNRCISHDFERLLQDIRKKRSIDWWFLRSEASIQSYKTMLDSLFYGEYPKKYQYTAYQLDFRGYHFFGHYREITYELNILFSSEESLDKKLSMYRWQHRDVPVRMTKHNRESNHHGLLISHPFMRKCSEESLDELVKTLEECGQALPWCLLYKDPSKTYPILWKNSTTEIRRKLCSLLRIRFEDNGPPSFDLVVAYRGGVR